MGRAARGDEWQISEVRVTEFHETKMGRTFFEVTLPRLIAAIERLAEALEAARAGNVGFVGDEAQ